MKASGPDKRAVTFRLGTDVLAQLEDEAIEDGRNRESGRVYSPSATLDRILRAYFNSKPKRPRRPK